ncbi:MAG TPA: D-alanyl-D-alanine carboxypeptidase/D-alanyl-D-alanine-endopeptidase [Solirubrobacterales bacterium]|jgi:D-alanyl-D-alanine carboxypeptidase/D-alanyl-D-alanine-endopeptidase (penicillin-binding protein 4)|nr:D-alanyl-D-alanine carboxypeptidase/D-alanyl-D-alanine-endopeptidase [Solirubrobacterales bacterium]
MRKALIPGLVAALGLLLAFAGPAGAANSCGLMKAWLKAGGGSQSGLVVTDTETEEVVCAAGAEKMLPLASNTKLFTTATALSKLGPTATIPTKVMTDGTVDADGVLHGSLYLQGGGDPTLGTPAFYDSYLAGLGANIFSLVPQLKRAGIKRVTGRLYGDDTIFDRKRGVADSNYATSIYIGPLSGLDFNSGFAGNTSSGHFSSDPAKLATLTLADSMRHSGIQVSPAIALGKTPADAKSVAVVRSPPISEIVNTTDVYSDNFFAEMLEKLLGARFGGAGTTAAGTRVVEAYAQALGSDIQQVDGSGLTHSNLASPQDVVKLLMGVQKSAIGDEFIQDLALSGKEGTTAGRMKGTAAYGRCRLKTGTLTGVSNLSGYCFNTSGKVMAFSTLMGSVGSTETAHYYQDKIAGLVASY